MKLKNIIERHPIYYLTGALLFLSISYTFLGYMITIILNFVIVVFSFFSIEKRKKGRSIFLIATILWGIFPIVESINRPISDENPSLSEEEIDRIAIRVISKFEENFGNLEDYNISLNNEDCISNVTTFIFEGEGFSYSAEIYDSCDVKRLPPKKGSLSKTALMTYLIYPLWNKSDNEIHYFFDLYDNDPRRNRLSLFLDENKYIIGKFYDEKGTAYEVPINASDWDTKEWAMIIFQSNEIDQQISVTFVNIKKDKWEMNFVNVTDYSLDFEELNMYVGSDIYGKHQADAVVGHTPPEWIFSDDPNYNPTQMHALS